MKTRWMNRVVTDTLGDAGSVVLEDESTAWIVDAATGTGITDEADVEIAAEYLYAAAYDEN